MTYEEIYSEIENKILTNQIKPKEKLLSENQLCTKFNISRTMARDLYNELVNDGYIFSIKGKGYFVNDKKFWMKNISLNKRYPDQSYKNELIDFEMKLPNWFIENYNLDKDDFKCFAKMRYLDDKKTNLTYIFLNKKLIQKFDLIKIKNSVVLFLKEQFDFKKSYNFIKIENATEEDAIFLDIKKDDLIVCEYSIIYHNNEVIIQCSLDKKILDQLNFGYIANVL